MAAPSSLSSSGSAFSPWRNPWLSVALLVPVALLNYLDRQMLASMKFSVMRDIPDIAVEANWARSWRSSNGCTRASAP